MSPRSPIAPWVLVLVLGGLAGACRNGNPVPEPRAEAKPELPRGEVHVPTAAGPFVVQVEIAETPEARARGLMFRKELAETQGMLFLFPKREVQSFWMKNTYVPLDMLFLEPDGTIVGVVEDAEPLSTASRTVGRPSQLVLEVPAGFVRRHQVPPGGRVSLRLPEVIRSRWPALGM